MGGGDVMLDSCSCRPLEKILFGVLQDHQELPPEALQPLLDQVWGLRVRFQITHSLGKKFVFHFDTKEERDLVLENAPWAVDGMFLMLKPLDFNEKGNLELLDFEELKIERTPIWVQIHGLPLELRPWVVQRRPMWVQFRYERVFKLCYICGRIGHKKQSCDLTLEEAERVVFERADEVGWRLGCGVATDYSRRLYTGRVRAHHRGLTWGSRRRSNRVIFFDEEDGMPPVNPADFDDDEDPSLTIYMMRKMVGGGGKVVFEQVDIDIEDTYWVKESRLYWREI